MYESKSYQRHTEFLETSNNQVYVDALFDENNPIHYYNNLFFKLIAPIASAKEQWLTVGDCTGIDAAFLKKQGVKATATDLNDRILSGIKAQGYIDNFDVQNVEKLTYSDDSFDFVCCKEAYHHFPRPAIGFYEMLRVSKKGLILLEPNDLNIDFAPLLFVRNLLDRFNTQLLRKIWKNQYSYETVGNFVFKISVREIEKMTAALDLPCIAHKGFNSMPSLRWKSPTRQQFGKAIYDGFCKIGLLPYQHLSCVVFKQKPDEKIIAALQKEGYKINMLPKNPYA
jgi:ubiquinone/menaquinone biosynthesis C-methylase UbiE